ncbi:peroxisome assembly protein 26-like, partial [Engraulis encrasicolus]|uniref:peroxisome assembly protein 26-like n=1 Tax=Engraulis encrasicolus TaxID=184585 RepID=UPI002FCE9CC3
KLNQWRGVLGWVLQHYDCADKMPAKIMQMCILLYSKVGEHTTMQDAGHMWLHCPENSSVSGYATVAELYLLHVLIPLGLAEEAQRLVSEEVGNVAFTTEQRQVALDLLERQKQTEGRTPSSNPGTEEGSQMTTKPTLGPVVRKLLAMLRLLQSGISSVMTRWRFIPARRLLLAVLLLYLLLVRMDPALPSSFPWVFKLLGLLRQMWHAMFGPYYRANATA